MLGRGSHFRHRIPMRTSAFISFVSSLFCVAGCSVPRDEAVFDTSRQEFARSISGVTPGMSEDEVLGRVGLPDDIWIEEDLRSRGIQAANLRVFCYGSQGHRLFPTLGRVYIDDVGKKVTSVCGKEGKPPN